MSLLTMATIEEDYVSFETAKLLKEKGFEGYSIISIFDEDAANAYIKELQEKHLPYSSDDPKLKEFYYPQPTLQMAMKWLREKHGIYIDISIYVITKDILKYNINVYYKKHKNDSIYLGIHLTKECSKYEQACEAAIKYCLENLI
jgi:hypothetical protein